MSKYTYRSAEHNFSSANEIVPVLIDWYQPKSVIDIGCGLGEFLKVFKDSGCKVLGIDQHDWNNEMNIDYDDYCKWDLSELKRIPVGKFDLCLCLEVAEHLPKESSDYLIQSLTNLSDHIVFSAAIPGQGGQGHINEQMPQYWQTYFNTYGYGVTDDLKLHFWNNEKILWWYRQNILSADKVVEAEILFEPPVRTFIHPELYKKKQIWWGLERLNAFVLKRILKQ